MSMIDVNTFKPQSWCTFAEDCEGPSAYISSFLPQKVRKTSWKGILNLIYQNLIVLLNSIKTNMWFLHTFHRNALTSSETKNPKSYLLTGQLCQPNAHEKVLRMLTWLSPCSEFQPLSLWEVLLHSWATTLPCKDTKHCLANLISKVSFSKPFLGLGMLQRKAPCLTVAATCVDLVLHSKGLESGNLLLQGICVKLEKLRYPLKTSADPCLTEPGFVFKQFT